MHGISGPGLTGFHCTPSTNLTNSLFLPLRGSANNKTLHRPIILTMESDALYECDFVLATLTDPALTQQSEYKTTFLGL